MNNGLSLTNFKFDNFFWVRLAALIAFTVPFFLCFNLWFSERLFPLIPIFDSVPHTGFIMDLILISVQLILFIYFVFNPSWKIALPIVFIYVFWVFQDQNRIQPFYFEIIFIVLAISQSSVNPKLSKRCILLVLAGTYFWSGFHKFNDTFFNVWANGLNRRIPFVPDVLIDLLTYSIPLLEALFGVFLLVSKTRKLGIWLLAFMHAMIIITFILGNSSYIVFALNIFNVFTLFFLFYNDTITVKEVLKLNHPKVILFFCISVVFPIFNLFGAYDHILAFSYFSGKPKYCRMHFSKAEDLKQLPEHIYQHVRLYNDTYYLDFNQWAVPSIKVMVYPEKRVYLKLQEHVNSYFEKPDTYLEYYEAGN